MVVCIFVKLFFVRINVNFIVFSFIYSFFLLPLQLILLITTFILEENIASFTIVNVGKEPTQRMNRNAHNWENCGRVRVMGGIYDIVKKRSCDALFQTSGNFATFRNLWDTVALNVFGMCL